MSKILTQLWVDGSRDENINWTSSMANRLLDSHEALRDLLLRAQACLPYRDPPVPDEPGLLAEIEQALK